jgi:serpin B
MARALHLSGDRSTINEEFRDLNTQVLYSGSGRMASGLIGMMRTLTARLPFLGQDKPVELNIANALWAEKAFTFRKEYLESIQSSYDGGLRQVDFRHAPEAARKTINSWVEEQTKDRIKDLLGPGMIATDTRLVLTNAIYFKGFWETPFKKEMTKEGPFTLLDGKEVQAPMMHDTRPFRYMKEEGLQVLEMPYKGGELAMVVLLPSKERRLEDFERSITTGRLAQWMTKVQWQTVETYVPRFKMTSEFRLKGALQELGMTDAFSPAQADFSSITGNRNLFIEEGIHKAFVEVNEEGTEAAAATGLIMQRTGERTSRPPVFRADHPFVFLIWHKPSRCILFMGRVTRP